MVWVKFKTWMDDVVICYTHNTCKQWSSNKNIIRVTSIADFYICTSMFKKHSSCCVLSDLCHFQWVLVLLWSTRTCKTRDFHLLSWLGDWRQMLFKFTSLKTLSRPPISPEKNLEHSAHQKSSFTENSFWNRCNFIFVWKVIQMTLSGNFIPSG